MDGCWGQLESADKGEALVDRAMNSRAEKKYTGAWTRMAVGMKFIDHCQHRLELCEYIRSLEKEDPKQ